MAVVRKRIIVNGGGVDLTTIENRLDILENNEYKVAYFQSVSSATGSITVPTGATILLDQFQGGIDAYVSTISGGQPTGILPTTSGGTQVDVSSFDALGNYTLTGTPDSFPVAIIYMLTIKAIDYSNLDETKILDIEEIKIDARSIGDGTVNNTEFSYINSLTNNAQTQLNNKQPLDATLTALAGLDATAGLIVETALDTFTKRSIAGTASNISVTNGDGVLGNPTIDLVNAGTAGTYGSATQVAVITTDSKGRVTSAASTTINIPSTQIIGYQGYALTGGTAGGFGPADATTYYIGAITTVPITSAARRRIQVLKAGTMTKVAVVLTNAATVGTNELSTLYVRVNNTTDYVLDTAVDLSSVNGYHTGVITVSIPLVEGDTFEIKWVTPTWATNPANVHSYWEVYIE